VKFTTLIPTTDNDGNPFEPAALARLIETLWRPFGGMTEEKEVLGCWIDDDGTEFRDMCFKVSIECDRERLSEAMRRVRRVGRKLVQRVMYFEVSGYDGVQFLRID
jgi:hypothetical protein